jgi:hypothetical protein
MKHEASRPPRSRTKNPAFTRGRHQRHWEGPVFAIAHFAACLTKGQR